MGGIKADERVVLTSVVAKVPAIGRLNLAAGAKRRGKPVHLNAKTLIERLRRGEGNLCVSPIAGRTLAARRRRRRRRAGAAGCRSRRAR